jgi:hypothetical protein
VLDEVPATRQPVKPGEGYFISLDLHNVLDDGSYEGRIPAGAVNACKKLLQYGFILFVNSWIGLGGKHSQSRRDQAVTRCQQLAELLNLTYSCNQERGPRKGVLLLVVVDRKLYSHRHHNQPLNGKISLLSSFGTHVHFDDCPEICGQLWDQGYLAYHIVSWKGKSITASQLPGLDHTSSPDLLTAVNKFIAEFLEDWISTKLKLLWSRASTPANRSKLLPHLPECYL